MAKAGSNVFQSRKRSDHSQRARRAERSDLVSVPEQNWQAAVKRFKLLKPLLNISDAGRTLVQVQKVAQALGRHPATIYRWIEKYRSAGFGAAAQGAL
jgi:hypothetical protein